MKMKRIISAFLTLVMTAGSLTVGVDAAWEDKVNPSTGAPIIDYLSAEYKTPEDKLGDMILVKEQLGYQLYFEEFTGEVAIRDMSTGQILFSNPYDQASAYNKASVAVRQKLLSQILISYLDNSTKTQKKSEMNSYVEAALRGQITLKNIKNGIRVEYALGEEKVTRLVPRVIEKSRYEEQIYPYLSNFEKQKFDGYYTLKDPNGKNETEKTVAAMHKQFPITEEMAVYVCSSNISPSELRNVEKIIKNKCPHYTHEQLEYDHDLTNHDGDDIAPPRFRMALEYTITETGLNVRLPANGISFDETVYQLQTITVLPYMGAGSNEFTGYTFIPDGSGALIRFEDIKGTAYNVAGQMYGPDYAYHVISGQHQEAMRYPVFGVVTNYDKVFADAEGNIPETTADGPKPDGIYTDNGFLAIITEGDSLATLMSEHGGAVHCYNTVYATFTPRPSDEYNLADSISIGENAAWTVTSKRKYTESYNIKYIMLKDEEICKEKEIKDYYTADYVGMADAYRDYLTDTGVISKLQNVKEDIPLYIEAFGSIKTTERVASFPVEVDTPLTTFENIKTMYEELKERGISNVGFKLTGYANGGMEPTVPYKLKWIDSVGGNEGFADIVAYAEENGFDIFPDFDFAYVQNQENFDGISLKKHAVKTIDDRYTSRRAYDPATQAFDKSFSIAISPSVYEYLYDTFGPNYAAYGNDSISVATLGTELNSDFDEDEPYHREDSKQFTAELLAELDKDVANIMTEGGNSYVLPYADIITGMSLSSSRFVNASESIPFVGMVLHGSKVFTGSPTNMEGDINEAILRSIESGASMYFILSYDNTSKLKEDKGLSKYYSVDYNIWKDDLIKYYTVLNDAIKDLQDSLIVDHEFLRDAKRVPDADELEADKLAEEAAKAAAEAAAAAKLADEERQKRLEERLAAQAAERADEEGEAADIPVEDEAKPNEGNLNQYGEEEIVEDNAEEVVFDKYATVSGSVVRVAYENGVNFILNYNSYDVHVEYDGVEYTIGSLDFIRID